MTEADVTDDGAATGDEWAYFVQAGEGGPIKVGWAVSPPRRMALGQTWHWVELRLLGVCAGGRIREAELQYELAEHRIRGEWFWPTEEVLAVVKRCVEDEDGSDQYWQRVLEANLAHPPSRRVSGASTVATGESSTDDTVWPDDSVWDG